MNRPPDLELLHAPHAALLRAALAELSPAGSARALDIGCGPGLKAGWLAAGLAPGGLALGLDIDRGALRAARDAGRPASWLAGDAHVLPLRPGSLDLCWYVAALDLLADPPLALAEARRALRPGGWLVVAGAAQLWARPRAWPAALYAAGPPPLAPADDLGAGLDALLAGAGFGGRRLRAYKLDPPGLPLAAAGLPLAAWADLAPHMAGRLGPADLAACAAAEAQAEPEPLPLLLLAAGRA